MAFNNCFFSFLILFSTSSILGSGSHLPDTQYHEIVCPTPRPANGESFRQISFQLARNLIVVKAYVNGKKGNFIIDTGAEALILNKKYFFGNNNNRAYAVDLSGAKVDIAESQVQFGWEIDKSVKKYAVITDLSRLEQILGGPVMGYIGYEVLRDYEVFFDFGIRQISLINIDKQGNYTDKRPAHISPIDSLRLHNNSCKPYLIANVGGRKLRFSIDTGAGRSLIRKGILRKIKDHLEWQKEVFTAGFNGEVYESKSLIISNMDISQTNWNSIEVIVAEKWQSIDSPRNELDGVLGYDFIKQRNMGINFIKKQVYFTPNYAATVPFLMASTDPR